MADCIVCDRETSVTASCPHCGAAVCADHRPTAAHDCEGLPADRTRGWVIDLDGPQPKPDREGGDGADPDWRDLLTPSRSGAYTAAGTLVVLLLAVVLVTLAAPGGSGAATDDRLNETRVERLVAAEANERRTARGLEPVAYDPALAEVAAAHSRDMHERDYFAHEGPDGQGVADRYDRFGIDCHGGENIYYTGAGGLAASERVLADHLVREWMNSPPHRETLLRERYTRQGIGIVIADGGVYATQDFC